MTRVVEQGNVVQQFSLGNTRVKICDDYCRDRSPCEIDLILKRIASRALELFTATTDTTACSDSNDDLR